MQQHFRQRIQRIFADFVAADVKHRKASVLFHGTEEFADPKICHPTVSHAQPFHVVVAQLKGSETFATFILKVIETGFVYRLVPCPALVIELLA